MLHYSRFYSLFVFDDSIVRNEVMLRLSGNPPGRQAFFTPREISDILRISVYTVRRWIKEGSLPAYKVGRGWRISDVDLEQWLNQQRIITVHTVNAMPRMPHS